MLVWLAGAIRRGRRMLDSIGLEVLWVELDTLQP